MTVRMVQFTKETINGPLPRFTDFLFILVPVDFERLGRCQDKESLRGLRKTPKCALCDELEQHRHVSLTHRGWRARSLAWE